jgi:hypothetical protein
MIIGGANRMFNNLSGRTRTMRTLISAAAMAALLAATSLAGIAPAVAGAPRTNFDKQNQYIGNFCTKYRGADQCNDWRADHTNWTSEQYRNFYSRHQNDKEFATPEATALFGAGLGAPVTGTAQDGGGDKND